MRAREGAARWLRSGAAALALLGAAALQAQQARQAEPEQQAQQARPSPPVQQLQPAQPAQHSQPARHAEQSEPSQPAVRPEIGKPLLAAEQLIKEQRYKEALQRVRTADAVSGKSADERYLIERMRLSAASAAGDLATAAQAFEALETSGRLADADKRTMLEALAVGSYRAGDYARAAQWAERYLKAGGGNGAMRGLLAQSLYSSGDAAGAVRELGQELKSVRGAPPPAERLQLLLAAAQQAGDAKAAQYALEQLARWYPKPEYWIDLIARVERKPGWSPRLALDAWRLRLATGSMNAAADYLEMAQLALQAHLAAEAQRVLEHGYTAGVLGHGADAARQQRLRDLAAQRAAEHDPSAATTAPNAEVLLTQGLDRVYAGDAARGLALMQQALAQGGFRYPEDARLHFAVACIVAGERAKAEAALKAVRGSDGSADLARLWALHLQRPGKR